MSGFTAPSWLRYALGELADSFRFFDRQGPRNRDFVWMYAVMILLISVLALSSAMYRGLIVNFADSILGHTAGAGVPVRVAFDTSISTINDRRAALSLFGNSAQIGGAAEPTRGSPVAGYQFHPFIEVEANSVLRLPENSWLPDAEFGFGGWAVAVGSPLWRTIVDDEAGASTTIIASRHAFEAFFDRDRYLDALRRAAPRPAVAKWEAENAEDAELRSLIVQVPYSPGRWQFKRFEVRWVDSFPSVQRIAFVVSLQVFKPLENALRDPLFEIVEHTDPIDTGASTMVSRVDFENTDRLQPGGRDSLEATFAACLGSETILNVERTSFDTFVRFDVPIPKSYIDACKAEIASTPSIETRSYTFVPSKPEFTLTNSAIIFDCAELSGFDVGDRSEYETCLNGGETMHLSLFSDFIAGLAYVPDRRRIIDFVDAVEQTYVGERRAFFISELYRSSINRFRYLVSTFEYISIPSLVFFIFIAAYSLFTSASIFFSSRRTNYGVLMARGMSALEVRLIVFSQFFLCFLFALAASYVVIMLTKVALQGTFANSQAYALALDEIGLQSPTIVDSVLSSGQRSLLLSLRDIAFGGAVVAILTAVILWFKLRQFPLTRRTFPMELISG